MGRLSSSEITKIATRLNNIVNIPVLGEQKEQIIFEKIINSIDTVLYSILPDEIYDTIHMASDGITPTEAGIIRTRIEKIVAEKINIPFVSEEDELKLIRAFLDIIEAAIQTGKNIIDSF